MRGRTVGGRQESRWGGCPEDRLGGTAREAGGGGVWETELRMVGLERLVSVIISLILKNDKTSDFNVGNKSESMVKYEIAIIVSGVKTMCADLMG